MTSLHRLIAIILIWLVVAFLGTMTQGLTLFAPPFLIILLLMAMLVAAAAASWAIARAR